jgi:hypothetical protein
MKNKRMIYLLVMALWCLSCDLNILNDHWARQDPFSDVVTVQEIKSIHAVSLTWRKDAGADNYIVMRSISNENGFLEFLPIYHGAEWTYIDLDIEVSVTYAYRLDKARGNKIIEGDRYVYYARPLPFEGTITARSVNEGRSVYLSWEVDENADKYIVMKTEAGSDGVDFSDEYVTEKIELVDAYSYIDNHIVPEKSYAYRIDKICGNRVFKGTEITFLGKKRPDPFPGIIVAQNLNNGKSAYLSWQADEGADAYRIMRAVDDGSPLVFQDRTGETGFSMQGPTSAIDSILEDDKGYFYRLDKQRENIWIAGLEITTFSRTRPMPFADTPVVTSFRVNGSILISWKYDEGVDAYIVMRSFDKPPSYSIGSFSPIYEGTAIQFIDTAVEDEGRYAYKLYKRRNGIIYPSGSLLYDRIALGVSVKMQEDNHEPNDIEAQATLLELSLQANIYCYGFTMQDNVLQDIDWYRVSVPAYKTAHIVVEYNNEVNDRFLLVTDPVMGTYSVTHGVPFQVKNDTAIQKYVTFAIRPDKTRFLLADQTGGMVVSYTLKWQSITSNS